ncbi:MAG: hypothetical protein ABEH90_11440 [Halolamina sp.]
MSAESELVERLIRYAGDSVENYPEAPYQNYGFRGFADLCQHWPAVDSYLVFEVKSESALRGSTGPNEIVRQFNKMVSSFFADSRWNPPNLAVFELCFVATEHTVEHLLDYPHFYDAAARTLTGVASDTPLPNPVLKSQVTLRHPSAVSKAVVAGPETEFPRDSLYADVRESNRHIATRFEDLLRSA